MENQAIYKKARKKVRAKFGFYVHLSIYLLVNVSLIYINLSTSPDYYWFIWPLIGWGVGLLYHAFGVEWSEIRGFSFSSKNIECYGCSKACYPCDAKKEKVSWIPGEDKAWQKGRRSMAGKPRNLIHKGFRQIPGKKLM